MSVQDVCELSSLIQAHDVKKNYLEKKLKNLENNLTIQNTRLQHEIDEYHKLLFTQERLWDNVQDFTASVDVISVGLEDFTLKLQDPTIPSLIQTLTNLSLQRNTLSDQLNDLYNRILVIHNKVLDSNEEKNTLKNEIDVVAEVLEEDGKALKELTTQVNSSTKEDSKKRLEASELYTTFQVNQAKYIDIQSQITTYIQEKEALEKTIYSARKSHQDQVNKINESIQKLSNTWKEWTQNLETLNKECCAIQSALDTLHSIHQQKLEEQNEVVQDYNTQQDQIIHSTQIHDAILSNISTSKSTETALTNDITHIKEDGNHLLSRLHTQYTGLEPLKESVSNICMNLSNAKVEVESLQHEINMLNTLLSVYDQNMVDINAFDTTSDVFSSINTISIPPNTMIKTSLNDIYISEVVIMSVLPTTSSSSEERIIQESNDVIDKSVVSTSTESKIDTLNTLEVLDDPSDSNCMKDNIETIQLTLEYKPLLLELNDICTKLQVSLKSKQEIWIKMIETQEILSDFTTIKIPEMTTKIEELDKNMYEKVQEYDKLSNEHQILQEECNQLHTAHQHHMNESITASTSFSTSSSASSSSSSSSLLLSNLTGISTIEGFETKHNICIETILNYENQLNTLLESQMVKQGEITAMKEQIAQKERNIEISYIKDMSDNIYKEEVQRIQDDYQMQINTLQNQYHHTLLPQYNSIQDQYNHAYLKYEDLLKKQLTVSVNSHNELLTAYREELQMLRVEQEKYTQLYEQLSTTLSVDSAKDLGLTKQQMEDRAKTLTKVQTTYILPSILSSLESGASSSTIQKKEEDDILHMTVLDAEDVIKEIQQSSSLSSDTLWKNAQYIEGNISVKDDSKSDVKSTNKVKKVQYKESPIYKNTDTDTDTGIGRSVSYPDIATRASLSPVTTVLAPTTRSTNRTPLRTMNTVEIDQRRNIMNTLPTIPNTTTTNTTTTATTTIDSIIKPKTSDRKKRLSK